MFEKNESQIEDRSQRFPQNELIWSTRYEDCDLGEETFNLQNMKWYNQRPASWNNRNEIMKISKPKKIISKQKLSTEAKENIELDKIIKDLKSSSFNSFDPRRQQEYYIINSILNQVLKSAEILRMCLDSDWRTLDQIYRVQTKVKSLMKENDFSEELWDILNKIQEIACHKIDQKWRLKQHNYKMK